MRREDKRWSDGNEKSMSTGRQQVAESVGVCRQERKQRQDATSNHRIISIGASSNSIATTAATYTQSLAAPSAQTPRTQLP